MRNMRIPQVFTLIRFSTYSELEMAKTGSPENYRSRNSAIKKVLKTGQFSGLFIFCLTAGTPSGGKIDVDSQIIIHLVSF